MTGHKKGVGARKTVKKAPRGREIKKTFSIGLYPSQVEIIKKKHGLSLQRWMNKIVAVELAGATTASDTISDKTSGK